MDSTNTNPLDKSVDTIVDNKEYLQERHVQALLGVLPLVYLKKLMPQADSTVSKSENRLSSQLARMMQLQETLMNEATSSADPDLKKKALTSGKDLFNLYAKFEALMDRQSRQANIEAAVKEAFIEIGNPELEQIFLKLLKDNLIRAAKSRS